MSKNKRNHPHKNLRRTQRLNRGTDWLKTTKGADLIQAYIKRYGVDVLCAIVELRLLGAAISEEEEYQVKQEMEQKRRSKHSNKKESAADFLAEFSDENFAFIAGYTSSGVPFGWRHEEVGDIFE